MERKMAMERPNSRIVADETQNDITTVRNHHWVFHDRSIEIVFDCFRLVEFFDSSSANVVADSVFESLEVQQNSLFRGWSGHTTTV